ncbi:MAG: hypothetical protein NW237_02630 [Cyanobacteriota bacterium]|nr:hypothetical protein [Cyanobacteriota bacterium]
MSRHLNALNQILEFKLDELRLFGKAERKGPILNVMVERMRGDVVDTQVLTEIVRAAVDASLIQNIRKVNIYLWHRHQETEEPEWSGGFGYEPLLLATENDSPPQQFRQDYANIRILYFVVFIILVGLSFLQTMGNWLYWLLPILALTLGIGFPAMKRWIKQVADPFIQHVSLGTGLFLLGISLFLMWQQSQQFFIYVPLILLTILLIGLGI